MKTIELYDVVVVTKDIDTRESPSVHVKAGTLASVLRLEQNKNGEVEYLVEFDNRLFDRTVTAYLRRDEIEKKDN